MRKLIIAFFVLLIGGGTGYFFFNIKNHEFKNLNAQEKLDRILEERGLKGAHDESNIFCDKDAALSTCSSIKNN